MTTRLYTGAEIDYAVLLRGDPSWRVDLRDLLMSLSRLPRYLGHTNRRPISVLEHSVLVSEFAFEIAASMCSDPVLAARVGLLHDAAEAIVGDLPADLRAFLQAQGNTVFEELERSIQRQVFEQFGVDAQRVHMVVRTADLRARMFEICMLTDWPPPAWPFGAAIDTETHWLSPRPVEERKVRWLWLRRALDVGLLTEFQVDEFTALVGDD